MMRWVPLGWTRPGSRATSPPRGPRITLDRGGGQRFDLQVGVPAQREDRVRGGVGEDATVVVGEAGLLVDPADAVVQVADEDADMIQMEHALEPTGGEARGHRGRRQGSRAGSRLVEEDVPGGGEEGHEGVEPFGAEQLAEPVGCGNRAEVA